MAITRKEQRERDEFERLIADEIPSYDLRQTAREAARLLCRHGKTYARFQEMACNGVGTWYNESNESFARRQDWFEKRLEHREQILERRIRQIVAAIGTGFDVIFQGDPRGSTIKVKVPSGRTNDWGKEGICVPTS